MQFNQTASPYSGLIQECERWCRFPVGGISGDSTLLGEFTTRINSAFERIMPILLSYNDQIRWDDLNHTNQPVGYVNIVSGQSDYKITTDASSLDILNLHKVRVYTSDSAAVYTELDRVLLNDPRVPRIISPDSNEQGAPSHFLEKGNVLYLYPQPDYSVSNGIELFFSRQQLYFTTADTTKEPGIPLPFHRLLALIASLEWNQVNRTDDTNLLAILRGEIDAMKKDLSDFVDARFRSKKRITSRITPYI